MLESEVGRRRPVAQYSSFLLQGVNNNDRDFQCLGYFLLSFMSSGWQLLQPFEICLKQRKLPRFVVSLWFSSYNIFDANIKAL